MFKKVFSCVTIWLLFCLIVSGSAFSPQQCTDEENFSKHLGQCMAEARKITVRMTRAEIPQSFKHDGGLEFFPQSRYLIKDCFGVKIDVDFALRRDRAWDPADKVVRISKPYLEEPFAD